MQHVRPPAHWRRRGIEASVRGGDAVREAAIAPVAAQQGRIYCYYKNGPGIPMIKHRGLGSLTGVQSDASRTACDSIRHAKRIAGGRYRHALASRRGAESIHWAAALRGVAPLRKIFWAI